MACAVALVLLLELDELALSEGFAKVGGGEVCEEEDEGSNPAVRSLRMAASVCESSLRSELRLVEDELVDEAEDAAEVEDDEELDDDEELESSAARRSLSSVSNVETRLAALDELEAVESEVVESPTAPGGDAGGGPGGGPPAPPASEGEAPEEPPSCERNACTDADTPTALEASIDDVDVFRDDEVDALELDWLEALFCPARLACSNRKSRLC